MKKRIIYCLFLFFLNIVLYAMVFLTVEANKQTLERIDPLNTSLDYRNVRPRLTVDEVNQITKNINADLRFLNPMKGILIVTAVCLIALLVASVVKSKWHTTRFDGLALIIIAILSLGFHWLFVFFNDTFENAHNATINIRIATTATLVIVQPLLFFVAYKWNRVELHKHLHQQKWVSIVAIGLTIISGLIALAIGIGILLTPDLSGNIS
jgi:lysylphosphatidylglycerol synthetase-like protein (DUF2156 family)